MTFTFLQACQVKGFFIINIIIIIIIIISSDSEGWDEKKNIKFVHHMKVGLVMVYFLLF